MFLLEQVVNGLVLGGYYLLIALGLSLIFSVGGVVNLAHGAFYALGAYVSIEVAKYLGFGAGVVISPVAVALLGILFERFILRRFYTADPILSLLVTFGLAMVAEQLIRIIWGASPLPASMPRALKGSVVLGDFLFSRYRLLLLAVVAVVLAGIVALRLLPVSPLPQVDFPTISVSASLPGASPETMAATVATPLERALGRIAGVTEMTSSSGLGSTRSSQPPLATGPKG